MTTIYDLDEMNRKNAELSKRVTELEAERAKDGLDLSTIAAVLFGDAAGQGRAEICAAIRNMQGAIHTAAVLINSARRIAIYPLRNDALVWLETYVIEPTVPPAAGDDPCEQCGQPCDGSRCPDSVS